MARHGARRRYGPGGDGRTGDVGDDLATYVYAGADVIYQVVAYSDVVAEDLPRPTTGGAPLRFMMSAAAQDGRSDRTGHRGTRA